MRARAAAVYVQLSAMPAMTLCTQGDPVSSATAVLEFLGVHTTIPAQLVSDGLNFLV